MLRKSIHLLALTCLVVGSGQIQAQQHLCGVDEHEGQAIKADMLSLRARYSQAEVDAIRQRRSNVYVPVTIHIVGNMQGEGFASASTAMGMICKLNQDFADQNVQFHLHLIRYVMNNSIFDDAYSSSGMLAMRNNKIANTLNIFVSANTSRPVAGYYSRTHDYVYMQTGYANSVSTTITHEVGHFFTLPHTFVGWENLNVNDLYGTDPVPSTIGNNRPVERVVRSGSDANCDTAADGFCDTPADYLSFRISCPFRGQVKDPLGETIEPDSRNYMSYFSDNCMDRFSDEQKDAMMRNIVARNWHQNPAPAHTPFPAGYSISNEAHQEGEQLVLSGDLRLEWTAISEATGYWLELERTLVGTPVETVFAGLVEDNFINIPLTDLRAGRQYTWRVRPYNIYQACEGHSPWFNFGISAINPTSVQAEQQAKPSSRWEVLNAQPIQERQLRLLAYNSQAQSQVGLQLVDFSGRVLLQQNLGALAQGDSHFELDLQTLPAGMYVLVIRQAEGIQTLRLQLR